MMLGLFKRKPEWQKVIERRLGYHFNDVALLEMALTHRSHAYEQADGQKTNYERLEFLGDAALGMIVSEWLYRDDEHVDEGVLTRRRQSVVCTPTLAATAAALGLDEAIRLGRGEEQTGGREKQSLMADIFEAVLGAIFIDGGMRPSREFVLSHLQGHLLETRRTTEASGDHKTRLQENVQARLRLTPTYRIVSTSGPPHALRFEAEVLVADDVLGVGAGTTRKRAEQDAARIALEKLDES
jgi:ribonuclease-3